MFWWDLFGEVQRDGEADVRLDQDPSWEAVPVPRCTGEPNLATDVEHRLNVVLGRRQIRKTAERKRHCRFVDDHGLSTHQPVNIDGGNRCRLVANRPDSMTRIGHLLTYDPRRHDNQTSGHRARLDTRWCGNLEPKRPCRLSPGVAGRAASEGQRNQAPRDQSHQRIIALDALRTDISLLACPTPVKR